MSANYFVSPSLTGHPFSNAQDGEPVRVAPAFGSDQLEPILVGESPAIRRLRSQVERIAPYFRTALIRGEIGAGKQTIGRCIHARSSGADGPFIVANAFSLAEAIAAEASFARAASLLESANGGTLYLEGIGELPFALQAGLVRFLRGCEERRAPYNGNLSRLNLRILTATHRDLRTLSAIGQFRQKLYMRLSVVEIFVPPLRQRVEDIPILAAWLLRRFAERTGQSEKVLMQATLSQLESRQWRNNLTELERVVLQAAMLAEGVTIEPRHLLALIEPAAGHLAAAPAVRLERLQDVIQQHVLEVLTRCGGNKLRAAELLGISRSTLYRMLDASSAYPG
jgi:DNA-binding NtrC family response regulator